MGHTDEEHDPVYVWRRTIVDVMVLYTTAARTAYGRSDVEHRIALSVAYLNEACNRSGVNARFRLVYQGEAVGHEETSYATDELHWLADDDEVAALRDAVGADLVSLFVREGKPTGGLAFLPGAFSVFNGSPFAFTHEIGHNLGCAHDRAHADASSAAGDGINFGYSFTPPGCPFVYGDIMSYVGSQIEQFSNPEKYFLGVPTGVPEGHVDAAGQPDGANNALVLNRTIPYAAGGRVATVPLLKDPVLDSDAAEFSFLIATAVTGNCTVEASSDLIEWHPLQRVALEGESIAVSDAIAEVKQRFYRARLGTQIAGAPLGYVTKTVPPGLSMISNPLESGENTIDALFLDPPEGTQVYKWMEGVSRWAVSVFSFGSWDDPDITLHPGEGVIVRNPTDTPFTLRFVGEANLALHNRVPLGESIRSSAIPQRGLITRELGYLPFGTGGQVMRMKAGGGYAVYTWDDDGWSPSEPVMGAGEAFWCRNPVNAFVWERALPSASD